MATVFAHMPGPALLLLVCHITSFCPGPISVAWLRDNREVTKSHGASVQPGGMGSPGTWPGCGNRVCLPCGKASHIGVNPPG